MYRYRSLNTSEEPFIHLGLTVALMRKLRGLSQTELAQKAGISRSHLSAIEAPGIARGFSVEVLFRIAKALDMRPAELLEQAARLEEVAGKGRKA